MSAVLALAAWQAGVAAPGSDDAVAAGQGAAELETVMVYARRLVPVSRVAATVSVITQETIERTLVSDVKQLVRYEPGLSVRSDPFRFGVDTIAIRGIGGNRVAVEVDGVPAAGGFAVGNFADSGRAFVDPVFLAARRGTARTRVLALWQRRHRWRRVDDHDHCPVAAGRRSR